MQKFRLSGVLVSLTLLTFSACAQPALAQENHRWHKQLVSRRNFDANAAHPSAAPTANLYSLQAAFVQDYPTIGANSDGSDLWPCLQSYQGGNGSNSDCATLGNPSIPTPTIAAVLGIPAYVWPLNNTNGVGNGFGCDALVNGTSGLSESQYIPCGQFETWYEDDTNDSTDDLLQRIVVRQGSTVIYDSGIVDFGPAGPTVKYPVDVILASDSNFGFWSGASVGPNNGNCTADISYPLTSPANPGRTLHSRRQRHLQRAGHRISNRHHHDRTRHSLLYESDWNSLHVERCSQSLLRSEMEGAIRNRPRLEAFFD